MKCSSVASVLKSNSVFLSAACGSLILPIDKPGRKLGQGEVSQKF